MEREEGDENEYKWIKSPWMVETDPFAEFSAGERRELGALVFPPIPFHHCYPERAAGLVGCWVMSLRHLSSLLGNKL